MEQLQATVMCFNRIMSRGVSLGFMIGEIQTCTKNYQIEHTNNIGSGYRGDHTRRLQLLQMPQHTCTNG